MVRTPPSQPIGWLLSRGSVSTLLLLIGLGSAQAADENRIAFDFFSMAPPIGWREQSVNEQGAYFHEQLPPNDLSRGCGLGIGTAFKTTGSLESDLAAYEYGSLPGNFNSEPPKFDKLKSGWRTVTRVYRNRYSPTIHKVVLMASKDGLTQSMTWDLTSSQVCQRAARASLETLTFLPAKRRIRSDGTQLAIVERAPEREPTTAEKKDPTKYTRSCRAPSTTCLAPKVDRVGAACTCQNYRGVLEMGTIMQ